MQLEMRLPVNPPHRFARRRLTCTRPEIVKMTTLPWISISDPNALDGCKVTE